MIQPEKNYNLTKLGQDLNGEASWDKSGYSVSLSSNGTIVAIGAIDNDSGFSNSHNSGHVRIYEYSDNSWNQLGQDIDGEAKDDEFGFPVSISDNGQIVAIASIKNDDISTNSGYVQIYKYNTSDNSWNQLGQTIHGEGENDKFGRSLSLSSDGTIIAIGSPYKDTANTGINNNSGYVRIYKYDESDNSWNQLGENIDNNEISNDHFGWSVSLSFDGTIVAISAIKNDDISKIQD